MLDVAAALDPPLLSILCNDPDAKLQTVVGNNNKICEVFEVFSFKFVKKFFDCIVNVSYSSVYLKKDKSYVQKVQCIPVNATSKRHFPIIHKNTLHNVKSYSAYHNLFTSSL